MAGTSQTSLTSDAPSSDESEREALLGAEPPAQVLSNDKEEPAASPAAGARASGEVEDSEDEAGKIRNTGPVPLIIDWALMMLVVGLLILAGATKDYALLGVAIAFLLITATVIAGGAVHLAGEQPEGEDDGRGPH